MTGGASTHAVATSGRGATVATLGRALVVTLAILVPTISYPSLVFSGPLEGFNGIAIGLGLLSAVVLTLSLALAGSQPGTVGVPQSEPAIILAIITTSVAHEMMAESGADAILPVVLALFLVSSLGVGLLFTVLGALKLGNLIRFVPYPLVVGFLAGMGWLLISGAVRVLTGKNVGLDHAPELWALLDHWLPAVVVGVVLFGWQRRRPHPLNLPVAALGIAAVFWAVALARGVPPALLAEHGWLLAPIPPLGQWSPAERFDLIGGADWGVIARNWPQLLTLFTVSLMAILMNASVIELAARSDVDLNRELRAIGVGNLVLAGFAALPGYHSLSVSMTAIRLGRPSRLVSLAVALLLALLFSFGGALFAYVPKLTIGALLIYAGLTVLTEAVENVHVRRSPTELVVAILVFVLVGFVGLLEGLTVGVLAGVVLFVVKYSRVNPIRRLATGAELHSNVVRAPALMQALSEHGRAILVLELEGYLFFGTTNTVISRVRDRVALAPPPRPRRVILDFKRVSGIDSSVMMSLAKLVQYALAYDFEILVSCLVTEWRERFQQAALEAGSPRPILFADDLDRALEICEDGLFAELFAGCAPPVTSLEKQLRAIGGEAAAIEELLAHTERRCWRPGEVLMRQGEASDDLHFVDAGMISVRLDTPSGRVIRLRSMGPGTVVGEIALYLNQTRSASVVADHETETVRLTMAALTAMEARSPAAAALFHRFMARALAEKLLDTTRLVEVIDH